MYQMLTNSTRILAQAMALFGGALLLLVVGVTFISIAGRALVPLDIGLGPIRGIYDITEIGIAAAVFAFLPWCQLERGHAAVDLFKPAFPKLMNRLLDVVLDGGMLAVAALIAWRLYLGMMDKLTYGETTLIAQIPVWQGYALSLMGAVGFVLVAAFCVLRSLRALAYPQTVGDA
ncbi:MAG: TRAP transporter small permease [Sulfitobacter sp.]|nr:TRAP transporter small permease [Sulfitobacter sp.]